MSELKNPHRLFLCLPRDGVTDQNQSMLQQTFTASAPTRQNGCLNAFKLVCKRLQTFANVYKNLSRDAPTDARPRARRTRATRARVLVGGKNSSWRFHCRNSSLRRANIASIWATHNPGAGWALAYAIWCGVVGGVLAGAAGCVVCPVACPAV